LHPSKQWSLPSPEAPCNSRAFTRHDSIANPTFPDRGSQPSPTRWLPFGVQLPSGRIGLAPHPTTATLIRQAGRAGVTRNHLMPWNRVTTDNPSSHDSIP